MAPVQKSFPSSELDVASFGPFAPAMEYAIDAFQRSVLFWDVMDRHPDNEPLTGVIAFRPEASLLYVNADAVLESVLDRLQHSTDIHLVVCDLSASPYIDLAGSRMISTSTVVIHTNIAPRWVAFLGFAIALLLLFVSSYFSWIFVAFPFWVFLISVCLLFDELYRDSRKTAASL